MRLVRMKSFLGLMIALFFSGMTTVYGAELSVVDRSVELGDYRMELIREYAQLHYGNEEVYIQPQAIVLHWTASSSGEGVYAYFYPAETENSFYRKQGRLNVSAQCLVERDGTIFRLTPETLLNRHAIGINWCAIGIENVGGVDGKEDLTQEQVQANRKLIIYLKEKYPEITYLLGHYQLKYMRDTALWKEYSQGYQTGKTDPGPRFMKEVIEAIKPLEFLTFPLEN